MELENMPLNDTCQECDYSERLKQFRRGKDLVYGKERIKSYKLYGLVDEHNPYDPDKLTYIYSLFLWNLRELVRSSNFKVNWLKPNQLVTATKGIFWDWNNKNELEDSINDVEKNGMHFPIFTLPKGIPHNQIDIPSNMENLYNAYNGNHRIDILRYMNNVSEVFTLEIPEFCEKSCTGFKYTPLVYDKDGNSDFGKQKLKEPVKLFHLRYCNDEMKIDYSNYDKVENYDIPLCEGVDLIDVTDYQFAFRILQEFQNVLEYPLKYLNDINMYPVDIKLRSKIFETRENWDKFTYNGLCPMKFNPLCIISDLSRATCNLAICCCYCDHIDGCQNVCAISKTVKR